ncbi:FUSC family protein [Catellatospora sp. TT07R-123]|uniref:FUSC family protein n=1 Tax=Catellatospora sp. TT07R-123 TaxID=2733863 RepID=UPI001B1809B2|nr:FUSC family protein [Catellatospora sp. TT07R-123]GHJ46342.1 FUSC family protein [Catellatospora sp. TT07R-123]
MDAAELGRRTRVTLGDRARRVRAGALLAAQAAIAAGGAWWVAHDLIGHRQPYFAPIAAVVTLAISMGQRMRRAFEIVAGNAVGILLGELLVLYIGRGVWQLALVVFLAMSLAVFLGGSAALVSQSASSGILVATLLPTTTDYFLSRFVDAVVGGAVALVVMGLLLPLNPLTVVSRAVAPLLDSLSRGLHEGADALEHRDADVAQAALGDMRQAEAQLRAFGESLTAGRELSTIAPVHWRKRAALTEYIDAADHLARALRNSRVLVRRITSILRDGEQVPPPLVDAVHQLADAVDLLRRDLAAAREPEDSRDAGVRAVRAAREAHTAGLDFSGQVVYAQVRSTATDLLRATGLPREDAERLVRRAHTRRPPAPAPPAPGPSAGPEAAS